MLFGHDRQAQSILAAMASDRMHHAWLFAGPKGVGKATFAANVAARLLAVASGTAVELTGLAIPEDHPTARLLAAGSHPDFRRLERLPNEKTGNLARNITVDQVRLLRPLFSTATSMGNRRVVIIDSVDDLERGAANALLKNLEEPPASTIFLLVTHQPGRLLPTIRSRCRALVFSALDPAAMTSLLQGLMPGADEAVRADLIAVANGSAAAALSYAALDMGPLETSLLELARTGDPTNAVRSRLAQSLALKSALPRYEAFLQRAPAFIAQVARRSHGRALESAIAAWSEAQSLAQVAIPSSLVPETVVFQMAGHVASLAPAGPAVKA